MHKEQWLELCEKSPHILVNNIQPVDAGPLAGLISELEFNYLLTGFIIQFETKEFSRAISSGTLSILEDSVRSEIMNTYAVIRVVNDTIRKHYEKQTEPPIQWVAKIAESDVKGEIDIAKEAIDKTLQLLKGHLAR